MSTAQQAPPNSVTAGLTAKNAAVSALAPGLSSSSLNSSPPPTSATSPTRPLASPCAPPRPALLLRGDQPLACGSAYPPCCCCPRPAPRINGIRPCGQSTRTRCASHRASSARARPPPCPFRRPRPMNRSCLPLRWLCQRLSIRPLAFKALQAAQAASATGSFLLPYRLCPRLRLWPSSKPRRSTRLRLGRPR